MLDLGTEICTSHLPAHEHEICQTAEDHQGSDALDVDSWDGNDASKSVGTCASSALVVCRSSRAAYTGNPSRSGDCQLSKGCHRLESRFIFPMTSHVPSWWRSTLNDPPSRMSTVLRQIVSGPFADDDARVHADIIPARKLMENPQQGAFGPSGTRAAEGCWFDSMTPTPPVSLNPGGIARSQVNVTLTSAQ